EIAKTRAEALASFERQVDLILSTLADRASKMETNVADNLSGKITSTMEAFSVEIGKRSEQVLESHAAAMDREREQREAAMLGRMQGIADAISSRLEQQIAELNRRQAAAKLDAERLIESVTDQSRARIAQTLRELADMMDNTPHFVPASANA